MVRKKNLKDSEPCHQKHLRAREGKIPSRLFFYNNSLHPRGRSRCKSGSTKKQQAYLLKSHQRCVFKCAHTSELLAGTNAPQPSRPYPPLSPFSFHPSVPRRCGTRTSASQANRCRAVAEGACGVTSSASRRGGGGVWVWVGVCRPTSGVVRVIQPARGQPDRRRKVRESKLVGREEGEGKGQGFVRFFLPFIGCEESTQRLLTRRSKWGHSARFCDTTRFKFQVVSSFDLLLCKRTRQGKQDRKNNIGNITRERRSPSPRRVCS